jgi:sialidase-1
VNWASPVNITGSLGNVTDPKWTWVGTGPPAGLQLASGRIIIPSYHSTTPNDDGEFSTDHVMYTDDGKTWHIGGNFSFGVQFPNECQAVELADNVVYINSRGLLRSRIGAISNDGGITFQDPFFIKGLNQPMEGNEGSTIKHPKNGWLFYSGLDDSDLFGFRYNLTLFISKDQGQTWQADHLINAGPNSYSALTLMPDGSVACLYEWEVRKQIVFEPDHFSFEIVWRL